MNNDRYYHRFRHFLATDLNTIESFREIKRWLKGKKVVIDLGCGVGYLTDYFNAAGLDNSPEAIAAARLLYPKRRFIYTDVSKKLPFENKSVDAFVCYNLIEHLNYPNRLKLFSEITRVLKKNGRVVFAFVDCTFWFNKLLAFLFHDYGINDHTHLFHWSPAEFAQVIRRHFRIVSLKHTSQYGKLVFLTRFFKGETIVLAKLKF